MESAASIKWFWFWIPTVKAFQAERTEALERDPSFALALSSLAGSTMNQNNAVLCDAGCIGHGFLHTPC